MVGAKSFRIADPDAGIGLLAADRNRGFVVNGDRHPRRSAVNGRIESRRSKRLRIGPHRINSRRQFDRPRIDADGRQLFNHRFVLQDLEREGGGIRTFGCRRSYDSHGRIDIQADNKRSVSDISGIVFSARSPAHCRYQQWEQQVPSFHSSLVIRSVSMDSTTYSIVPTQLPAYRTHRRYTAAPLCACVPGRRRSTRNCAGKASNYHESLLSG